MTTLNDLVQAVLDFKNVEIGPQELLEEVRSFDPDGLDRELRTPLQRAAEQGNLELVKILLENGAKVNRYDDYGRNALHLAKNEDVMEELLKHAALKDINEWDHYEKTPLHYAVSSGDTELMELLFEKGACPSAVQEDGGQTPLQLAAMAGKIDAIEFLLRKGASKRFRDNHDALAWHWARQFLIRTPLKRIPGGKEYWEDVVMPQLV